ncbi:MAG TPA: 50S ribosomal protein L29 [Eubacteriales bacterium]|jgi:large subunit ribosomal protein L29|nr:50S ribosomal protein L29 [Clostridia bacterium]HRX14287.1 50S ribosomal protein L29 [Eubacteriales bacterium]
MKANKVRELNNEELAAKLLDLKKELFNLRLSHATGQLTNNTALAICKKDIARVKTVLRERKNEAPAK